MQLYGFLAFFYCTVEISRSQFTATLIANGIKGNHFGEIVLIAFFLLKRTVNVCKSSVIISIITCVERVPPTALCSVLLGRTAYSHHDDNYSQYGNYMFCELDMHIVFKKPQYLYYNLQSAVLLHNNDKTLILPLALWLRLSTGPAN